jgi:hypothetical protein
MKRSKTQVMFQYLPGQVFRHDTGLIGQVKHVRNEPSAVNKQLVLDTLSQELSGWPISSGLQDPVTHPNRYHFVEPVDEVTFDLWPLTMRCRRKGCGVLHEFRRMTDVPADPRCKHCGYKLGQLPFLMVHQCGELYPLLIQGCPTHGKDKLVLDDTGSFESAELRCLKCNGQPVKGLGFRGCSCGVPGDGYYRSLTVRAPNRFMTQHFPLVTLSDGPMRRLMNEPAGAAVTVRSYLDDLDDLDQALDDAKRIRSGPKINSAEAAAIAEKLKGLPQDLIDKALAATKPTDDDPYTEIENAVGPVEVAQLGATRRMRERALVFGAAGDLRTRRLEDFVDCARRMGQAAAVNRLQRARQSLHDTGFSRLLVVENFPIALVAYGWTRLTDDPAESRVNAFAPTRTGDARTPLYVSTSNTEAVFLELDPVRVCRWLHDNDLLEDPPADERDARIRILGEMANRTPAAHAASNLVHTVSHALIRNLGERAGFGEDTMAEYLVPEALTIGLYANVHQEFTLGALVSLVEHNLRSWLAAACTGVETCAWDPRCSDHDGACANCLHLAFGCNHHDQDGERRRNRRNRDLDRALLFGTADPHSRTTAVPIGYWQ